MSARTKYVEKACGNLWAGKRFLKSFSITTRDPGGVQALQMVSKLTRNRKLC